jgi:hypothetical protein
MTSGQVIDAYLGEVAAALPGPPRARADIVAELRSGLLDAADAHRSAGLATAPAAEAAIGEFGDPRQLAAAFRPELTLTHARRLALTLAATGPLIGLLWAVAALASDPGIRPAAPTWQWVTAPPVPLAAAAFLIAALTALATVAATGRATRWLPGHPRAAATTASIGAYSAAAADLAIFALLASQLASVPGHFDPAPVTVATIASLTRLTLAPRAAWRYRAGRCRPTRTGNRCG